MAKARRVGPKPKAPPAEQPPETYTMLYCCGNCGTSFSAEFAKGTPSPRDARCDHCGCFAEKRVRMDIKFDCIVGFPRLKAVTS